MSAAIDPITGQPLPANAIQRVLFVAPQVHVYQIPPLTSTKGYTAATWTEDPARHIFTARLRVLETGDDDDDDDDAAGAEAASSRNVKVDLILEDPSSGQLFAAAPYTATDAVEPALDSSRFFAVRVQDGQGRKAVLGIGFEERPDAFDFGVALQEARKTVGIVSEEERRQQAQQQKQQKQQRDADAAATTAAAKRDYSLKDGETITVNFSGSKLRRAAASSSSSQTGSGFGSASASGMNSFVLPPPPGSDASSASSFSSSSSSFALPPPPPPNRRTAARRSVGDPAALAQAAAAALAQPRPARSAAEMGFDDGPSGEFA